ncbi:protein CHROMATIN REMODELING 19 [Physcomitrium patens]|nr:protein CHROMATIN REMODELING 19-like isoform X2 [Physcomitrium patens]XP_024375892.1 protein CHROMATIN REMODELING 19-like isoform X2 [Physcomitrium patens]XP_024375893.1 protein CHROMATIN REMODELING 19-like isoform X2 [Physcomitrium patens]XP_024375895.1 protein CHROMATIN REMODELING 19-like isoform X2 [Physcomitrium patens]PNR53368.1 hypothetical protein PHYPA_007043 [Physcomitrium patens]|eukprot:XP_024375891.1 protein CHROMATIN REMODELING 19-like isoform X2 [Physcomitrella patens]
MRGHVEELSDAEGGNFKVKSSRILGKTLDSSVSGAHRSEKKATKIVLKLSNGHSKDVPVQESLPAKSRPRIIIKRPKRPVELEEEIPSPDPLPSSPLFQESEDEKRKSRKHGKKRHRMLEDYVEYPELSSPSFLNSEEDEGVVDEDGEDEEEEQPRKSKKHKKKRRKKIEMVDDSDDEDFDPMAEMRRKKSGKKSGDSFAMSTPTLPNLLVERIDILGDEATNKNLHEISRPTVAAPLATSGLGQRSDDNPIMKTLQKCHRIAASLKSELKATSTSDDAVSVDRYAEVDASAAKIVSQSDVCVACGIAENDAGRVLKPYQLVGVNFMLLLHRKNVGGAILADEMGLGKTVQAVAFLALLKHLDGDPGPHLLVAPASLLENWLREIKKWCPAFTVVLYHGNERAIQYERLHRAAKGKGPAPFNVMLTCYSLFERQSEQMKEDRKFLKKWNWSTVLMDEAHLLKDRGSYRSKRLRDVAQKAKQRVMLTGTPLQNDLQELWSLLEFMMPDIFDTSGVDLDQYLGTRNCTSGVLAQDKDLINHIKAILGPFVLRRVKSDVMRQLVAKTHEVISVDMLEEQALAYKQAVTEYRALAMAARASKTSKATSTNILDCLARRQVSNIFTQLRKLGNHPLLIRRVFTDETVKKLAKKYHKMAVFGNECSVERVREELSNYSDFTLHRMCLTYGGVPGGQGKLDDHHVLASAKCQALVKLLPQLKKNGHRPLIFSQWTNMLDILEWALAVIGLRFTRLDGSTPVTERQNLVDEYNNNPDIFVFLLSTRAGGQGLNLTGADTVIIHDVDFNPQMDRQAEDRCHRIGQSKPVTVYRLVTNGTVDESIFRIAQQKLVLDAAVLESGGDKESAAVQNERDVRTMGEILSALLAANTS